MYCIPPEIMNLSEKLVTAWQSVDFLLNRVWTVNRSFIRKFAKYICEITFRGIKNFRCSDRGALRKMETEVGTEVPVLSVPTFI